MGATFGVDTPLGMGSSGAAGTYTPAVPGDWSPPPTTVGGALDQIAARVKALESVPGSLPETYSCLAGTAICQAVYLSGTSMVALADASDATKMPAIGFVATKPTATTCDVQSDGELDGFVGLIPGTRYWFDQTTPGGIRASVPTHPAVEQQAGFAKTTTILKIQLGVSPLDQL